MDNVKEAFTRVKQDIQDLSSYMASLKEEVEELKRTLSELVSQQTDKQTINPTDTPKNQTFQHISPTHQNTPTDKILLYAFKDQFTDTSTRNRGVPADRQTDSQTDKSIQSTEKINFLPHSNSQKEDKIDHLERVSEILNSLDSLKKDLRSKFKHLTSQEMVVFSTIYQLEEEGFTVDYSIISSRLHLTEGSIRDYVQKIIKKGIPLIKIKVNNKKILLSILPELKKVASLEAILTLREL